MSDLLQQIQSAVKYVESRQNADGGFCFYRYEDWGMSESNVPDTFYALSVLSFAGRQVPNREKVVGFLQSHGPFDGIFPSITIGWNFLNAMEQLGEPLAVSPTAWLKDMLMGLEDTLLQGRQMEWSGLLRDTVRLLKLAQNHGVSCPIKTQKLLREVVSGLRWPSGGYGWPGANLLDTCEVVRLYQLMTWKLPHAALEYARSCEDENLGFTLTPGASNAVISVLEAGIDIVRIFNERSRYEGALLHYLLACQTGKGGFARVPGALADLENTYIAFKLLNALGYV